MRRMIQLGCGLAALAMGPMQAAASDAVVEWNRIAAQAVAAAGRPGGLPALDFAMVQIAVYDAVEAIDGRFEPYAVSIPGASGSPAAAAARAAHDVLANRFPAQAAGLDVTYDLFLANNGLAVDDPGVSVGQQAAAAIIALRVGDGSYPSSPEIFVGGSAPGQWRPTPPAFAPMVAPWLSTVVPFVLRSPGQFRLPPPPALSSREYAQAYNEVKSLGALVNSTRTPEQTDLAYFFADNAFLYWSRALQSIADTYLDNIGDSARLFALVDIAMADAAITAWDSKRYYAFWRPITAIQQGDFDFNPRTVGDPNWLPLIATPAYPDYTSGANNLSGSATRALELFFGTDEMTFSLTSAFPLTVNKTRTYHRFSDAAEDVFLARIYEGIHFRFADLAGRKQGRRVAEWTFGHFLRPLEDEGDDKHDR